MIPCDPEKGCKILPPEGSMVTLFTDDVVLTDPVATSAQVTVPSVPIVDLQAYRDEQTAQRRRSFVMFAVVMGALYLVLK
jgi:hypothetical protein